MTTQWTPLGTVRRRLGAPQPKSTPYPEWLVAALGDDELADATVYTAWELARTATTCSPLEREALVAVATISMSSLRSGSTYVPVEEVTERLASLGASADVVAAAGQALEDGSEVIGRAGEYKPLVIDDGRLYNQRVQRQEAGLARRLKARLEHKPDRADYMKILDALDRVLAHRAVVNGRAVHLSAEQQNAVRTALTQRLTVISGGPGTGKTSIIVSMLRVLARLDYPLEQVVLAAPTGRAAHRMGESVVLGFGAVPEPKIVDAAVADALPSPRTLHRLLGYSPRRRGFRYGESNPLPYDLVIVDEASMIDLVLMERLLQAVRPEAKLVLLGDDDQLPSVDAGAVFADVVAACGKGASVELGGSYRVDRKDANGRALAAVFGAIREQKIDALLGAITPRADGSEVTFRGVEILETDFERFLERWFFERFMTAEYRELVVSESFDRARAFGHLRRNGIVAVTSFDAERINQALIGLNPAREGEPLIAIRNDYERGLFNGERGIVTPAGARFESGVTDSETKRDDVATAYAITVHKSQGSELDHVVVVLPSEEHPLLTRELLYTATTRARKSVTILGARNVLVAGVGRTVERRTGIFDRLA